MKIENVNSESFAPYGKIVDGMDTEISEILEKLSETEIPANSVIYTPECPQLQSLSCVKTIEDHLYGGMPVQMGYCNGHNTKLNCLEYHKGSEYNLGTGDFILLLAKMDDIKEGHLNSADVKAFLVPAGTLVEVYGTTLHYAPCHTDPVKGFQVLIILPKGTNYDKPAIEPKTAEDRLLWGSNKWLLAHKESAEASQGAVICIDGKNIDIEEK